ncbi:hypothetical protein [Butyrivibrio sp. MC2013]|uniref:hypothetical protein n=1 Tax=Butyrivibrio sp. MC2013 TaxID=1280686 RepID=UPI00042920F6|nr:hypothetical protein [Butyrivibrio sp. MC2013]
MGIVSVWLLAVGLALIFHRKVEDLALAGVAGVSVLLLLFGLIGQLQLGVYCTIAISLGCAIYIIFSFVRRASETFEIVFSAGSLIIAFALVFFVFNSMGRAFEYSDDFAHWGSYLKDLYYTGTLMGKSSNIHVMHPQGLLVWDYYLLKTWMGYTESFPLAFHAMVNLIALLPLLRYANGRLKIVKSLSLSVFIILTPLAVTANYGSLYADVIMALCLAMSYISLADYMRNRDLISILQIMSALYIIISSKRAGIFMAACFMITAGMAIYHNTVKIRTVLLISAGCMASSILWTGIDAKNIAMIIGGSVAGLLLGYILHNSSKIRHKEGLVIAVLIAGMIGLWFVSRIYLTTTDYNRLTTLNYFRFLFEKKYLLGLGVLPALLIFASGLVFYYFKRAESDADLDKILVASGAVISILVYIAGYLYLYISEIAPSNGEAGPYLPSFDRYMAPCYYVLFLYGIYLILEKYADKYDWSIFVLAFVACLFGGRMFEYVYTRPVAQEFHGFEHAGIVLDTDDKVLFVNEEDDVNGIPWNDCFQYYIAPSLARDIDYIRLRYYSDSPVAENGYITAQQLQDILDSKNYTYVYIQTLSDDFISAYDSLFPGIDNAQSGDVYEIRKAAGGGIECVLLDGSFIDG